MPLLDKIIRHIKFSGPLSVADFMNICLYDKDYGYYTNQKPIGAKGDFITAPEISQIFGELIGIWVISAYHNLNSPKKFRLLELGGGRGTLLKDILRVLKSQNLNENVQVEILEINPHLKEIQKATLCEHDIIFHDDFNSIKPDEKPIIIIANEFLDCLPIRQYIKTDKNWSERLIGYDGQKLYFGLGTPLLEAPIFANSNDEIGTIREEAIGLESLIEKLAFLLNTASGQALLIDYGHFGDETGDSFQALMAHKKTDVLENLGQADLTAHVDFGAIEKYAIKNGLLINGPNTQRELLKALGFDARFEKLIAQNPNKKEEITNSANRLIDQSAMGDLFKAIILLSRTK